MSRYRKPLALRPNAVETPIRTAMVMAAGLGKRMRPLTASRPKPLIEVAKKPLLDHVFDHLRTAGIQRVIVNVHYLADAVEAHLKARVKDMEVIISDERKKLLETFLIGRRRYVYLDSLDTLPQRLASEIIEAAQTASTVVA